MDWSHFSPALQSIAAKAATALRLPGWVLPAWALEADSHLDDREARGLSQQWPGVFLLSVACCTLLGSFAVAQTPDFHYATPVPMQGIAVYDAKRGVTVVLESNSTGRLWHWDGFAFREQLGPTNLDRLLECTYDDVAGHVYARFVHGLGRFDGSAWTQWVYPSGSFPGGLAFDGDRRRLIGLNSNATAVMEWNGSQWTNVANLPVGSLSLAGGVFAFQPVTRQMLLFLPGNPANSTSVFTWDGAAWSLQDNSGPPLLFNPVVAVDPTTGTAMLEGRTSTGTQFWSYLAGVWTRLPDFPVQPLVSAGLVWDGVGFLRYGRSQFVGDSLWRFQQGSWQVLPVQQPAPRLNAAMASSPSRREILMFGGISNGGTWRHAGRWQRLTPATTPPDRRSATLAWSEADQLFVLFGGWSLQGARLTDTWLWDGSNWTQNAGTPSPPPMVEAYMATDPMGGVSLVALPEWALPTQHWRWQGGSWQRLPDTPFAVTPENHAVGYDPRRNEYLIVGRAAVHAWNGISWRSLPALPGRGNTLTLPSLAYDPESQRMICTHDFHPEAYAWDGATWQILALAERGPSGTSMQTDFSRNAILSAFHRWNGSGTSFWNGGDALFTRFPATATSFGVGCGLDGAPGIRADGRPRIGDSAFSIVGELRQPAALGALVMGFPGPPVPLGSGCALWVGQPVGSRLGIADANGRVRIALPLPNQAALLGVNLALQAAAYDPPRSIFAGWTFSSGLLAAVGD